MSTLQETITAQGQALD